MKMAVSVESAAGVQSAIRDSIANSSPNSQEENSSENVTNKIMAIAKKILITNIEYEEVNNFDQSVLDTFKAKYTVLKPFNSGKITSGESLINDADESVNNLTNSTSQMMHQTPKKKINELPKPKRILFPRERVQIGWRSSGRKWQTGCGMMNVGNTCYLNSTLQALFHVPAMANWLISDIEHREECGGENGLQEGCIICAMAKTLISSQHSPTAIRPQLVYSRLKQICKHLIFGRQEDAHEFLRYLVEAMEKAYLHRFKNYKELDQFSKETTPLNQILGGYLKTSVRCLSCDHVSTTYQHFQDLLLDIRKPNTIEEALDGYFGKERLEDMGYKCESCKKKVSAIKQFQLERAPISLCIQLKRFSMVGTKINKYIAIRPRLDLSKYSTKKSENEILTYKLVAMVTHLGASQHCGHYTAIGLTDQGGYYQFDDSCVRPISLPNVLNTNAYIIFYELDENQQSQKAVCTQVSGENHLYKNEISKKSDLVSSPQKTSGTNSNFNSENHKEHDNSLFTPKILNKPESLNSSSESKFSSNVPCNFIGPLLPSDIAKNQNTNDICQNKENTNIPQTSNKLESSPSKLVIHYKNSSTYAKTDDSSNLKENADKKLDNSSYQCNLNKTSNGKINFLTETSEKYYNDDQKSVLPSMPKLDITNDSNCNSPQHIFNMNEDPKKLNPSTKENSTWTGPLSPNYLLRQQNVNSVRNPSPTENTNSALKSLVPYGSDIDDSNYGSDNDERNKNEVKSESKLLNGDSAKSGFSSSSNESTPDASPVVERIKSNPPSPHVVKTKAGLWQVTPITPKCSPKHFEEDTKIDLKKEDSNSNLNPFNDSKNGISIPTTSFYSGKNTNTNLFCSKREENTVKELTKCSYKGYGGSVLSWSGTKTEMDMVINEESRLERKRQLQDEEENDMDRGRQKKVKSNWVKQNELNPGYNPFQEKQLQKNNEQNRQHWNGNSNNNSNQSCDYSNNNGNNHRYNHFQNNFNFESSNNNNNMNNNNSNGNHMNYNKLTNGKINNSCNENKFKNSNSNSNSNTIRNNCNSKINKINYNNCFYRNDNSMNYNKNLNCKNKLNYPFINRSHNGNFFRRHNSKKFNSNQRLIHHQKNGEWR